MNLHIEAQSSSALARERRELLIQRWSFLLAQGRTELHLKQWFIASAYYQEALLTVEALLATSSCKNCALRCYLRALFECTYISSKIHGDDSIELLEQAGALILSGYLPMQTIEKLLEPLAELKRYNDADRDLWINRFFAGDAAHRKQLH
uniref:hypothetical protein n=1 Tax=Cellvibrio fontiphilus TaxID=1815559 RepID=UPI002B4BDCF3|nr:hypothetical protein [Cellvibrio fontiphilus]